MSLINTQKSSHWYSYSNGIYSPCYELPKKSGPGMKKVTLREARELSLLVSITTISNYTPKPHLVDWRIEQAIMSAVTLPRQRESFENWRARCNETNIEKVLKWAYASSPLYVENEDAFCQHVITDMDAQSEKARQFGVSIHDAVEQYLLLKPLPDEKLAPFVSSFQRWADDEVEEVLGVELVVGNSALGIAGRLDLHCILRGLGEAVVDFKTQNVKRNKAGIKTPAFYNEWPRQLAAYARCVNVDKEIAQVSMVIDSDEPGPVFLRKWDRTDHHWNMFQNCLELWIDDNEYNPAR